MLENLNNSTIRIIRYTIRLFRLDALGRLIK